MEAISEQLEFFKRVIGEVQDANQVDLALELLPIAQNIASFNEKGEEEVIELLEEAIVSFQAVFQNFNISKWTNKVLRTKKKKFKSDEEKLAFLGHELCHCVTCVHILSLIQSQTDIPEEPTILWVDDSPENNLSERERATVTYGLEIVLARSTDEALVWLAEHKAQFQSLDSAQFRVVTDWYRPDEKDGAAESLTRAIRDSGWEAAPVLVYCSETTNPSSLLSEHSLTATTSSDHLLAFYWASMKLNVAATHKAAAKRGSNAKKAAKTSAPVSKAPSSTSATSAKETPEPIKKKTSTTKKKPEEDFMAQFEEEEDENFELPPIKPKKSSTVTATKAKSTASAAPAEPMPKASATPEAEKMEEVPELPSTIDLDDEPESPVKNVGNPEIHVIEATLPSAMIEPVLGRVPTDIVSPPAVMPAKSRILDILASRIPTFEDDTPESDKMDVTEEEVEIVAKQPKKAGSGKGSSVSTKSSGGKIAKKNSKQLFGDEEGEDSDFLDDGEKMDVDGDSDFQISDGEEEVQKKGAKKTKSKASISRQATKSDLVNEMDPVSADVVSAASMTPGTKQKKNWNAFLMSRVPSASAVAPGSPFSILDESSDSAVEHLLATPPSNKPAKRTPAKKSSTVVGVKTTPSATPSQTPLGTPQISPVEKPRPPKPTAPMGPTPIASLSALDDDLDLDDEEDDDLPLFTKVPSGPVASSSNASENLINPSKSILVGARDITPVGQVTEVLLQAKNKDGLNINIGGANITVVLKTGGNAHEFDGYIEDNMNGTYTIKYFPTRLGTYRMIVQANGQHIMGSPFSVDVENRNMKKRTASTSIFSLDDELSTFGSPGPAKRPKREESSLPGDSMEEEIEATQVV